jgi:DNA-binding response OmpR family regulator
MSTPALLLVGDAGAGIAEQLEADGFTPTAARTRGHARQLAAGQAHDLVVLGDLDDGRSSLDLLHDIRKRADGPPGCAADVPVIVVSARRDPIDVLRAFEFGADDFVAAPADYLELRARVRAVLRRSGAAAARRMRVGALDIDLGARSVSAHGLPVRLSRLEFELLTTLAADPGRVFTKEELLRRVWGFRALGATRTLDSHACRLRRKLGGAIVTVWGVGYRLAG